MVTRIPFEQAPRFFWHDPIIFLIHLYSPGLSCLFSVPARSQPFLQVVLISYTGEWFENQDMNSTQCYWRDIVSQQTELIILCWFLSLSLSSSLFLLWFRVIQSKIEMSLKLTFVSFKSEMIFSPIMKQSPKLPVFFFFSHFTYIRNIVLSKLIESQGTFKSAPYSQSSNLQGHFFSIFTLEIDFLLKVILFNVFSLSYTTSPYYPSNL